MTRVELTPRQEDVVREMARGLSYGEIARALGMAESTVRTHVNGAFRRWGASSRSELLRAYARSRVPAAAQVLQAEAPSLDVVGWQRLILRVLDALESV